MSERTEIAIPDEMDTIPQALTDEELLADAICQVLSGVASHTKIAHALERPEDVARIRSLLNSAQGVRLLYKARRDITTTTTERIKRLLPRAVEEAAKLAFASEDTRTKATMLKDLMDRGGMGATHKIAVNSPEAYKRAILELADDPDDSDDQTDESGDK
jgi:hypothetical protein